MTYSSAAKCLALVLAAGLLFVAAADAAKRPRYEPFELLNPLLGPELSQWLLGPVSWMASKKEIEAYLALTEDAEAETFIEDFWRQRDPAPKRPDNPLRKTYRERLEEADGLYAEGNLPGGRTDRGTIFVVYGPPSEVDYEVAPDPEDPLIEVWVYEKDSEPGLDGEKPDRAYRFIKRGAVTRFYERLSAIDRHRRTSGAPPELRRP